MSAGPPLDPGRPTRVAVGILSLVQGGVFAWGAFVLPWHLDQLISVLLGLAGITHFATASLAIVHPGLFPRAWRLQAFVALALTGYLGWVLGSSAAYLFGVYGGLGAGLGSALLAAFAPVVLLTVPTSVWAWVATGTGRRRTEPVVLAALVGLGAAETGRWVERGREGPAVGASLEQRFEAALAGFTETSTETRSGSVMTEAPAPCRPSGQLTAVATYPVAGSRWPQTRCVRGDTPEALVEALAARHAQDGGGRPVKVDLLTGAASLDDLPPLAAPFALRPGLDGVCSKSRCLMPWQLVATGAFGVFRPLDFVPDIRMGVDPADLARRLDPVEGRDVGIETLDRLSTVSFVLGRDGRWRRFERVRPRRTTAEPEAFARAEAAAQDYVHQALGGDGRFIYQVHPFAGTVSTGSFSIARQSGTLLALCELGGRGLRTRAVAERGLEALARLARPPPRQSALRKHRDGPVLPSAIVWPTRDPGVVRLGNTALPLLAFVTCELRFGDLGHRPLIGRLGELLLRYGDPSGRFHPDYDLRAGVPVDGPYRLYADGQAVFALLLLERMATERPGSLPRPAGVYREAAERAMRFYGESYWSGPVRDLFFIEENWHCLAARAALTMHRVDAYERFCLDYVRFKARTILGRSVRADLVGGSSFGNLTVPQNTPTAGFGEAAAAALAVAEARGESLPEVKAKLRSALEFLVHTQWTEVACFACSNQVEVQGGFSASMSTPEIRIDYVQHAWAALGHGRRALRDDG